VLFPYVCPEPVLVKVMAFFALNVAKDIVAGMRFLTSAKQSTGVTRVQGST
jgi:hypothetical protein